MRRAHGLRRECDDIRTSRLGRRNDFAWVDFNDLAQREATRAASHWEQAMRCDEPTPYAVSGWYRGVHLVSDGHVDTLPDHLARW